MSTRPSFFAELQRRHVYKVGAAYAVGGWLLVQVITQVFPIYEISTHVQRILVGVIIAGLPVALVLAWLFDITPAGIVRTESLPVEGETSVAARERIGTDRKLNWVLGVLLILALGFLVAERTLLRDATPAVKTGAASGSVPEARAVIDQSIAVLPFENLSRDPDNAYFATGIQDEILTKLSKIKALKVISRTSTLHFASSPDNLPEIAAKLGVAAILEGSVQRSGDKVHINVQLIRAITDEHLWAESYDRTLSDIFAVQGEVAQAVATALSATLTHAEQQQIAQKPTNNAQAYEAYLRGLAMEYRYTSSTDDYYKRAAAYQAAVDLDPGFALAWAGLSEAQAEVYHASETTSKQLALAKHALDEATRLAPDTSETAHALALFRYYALGDYDGAFEAYSKALETRPNAGSVLYSMGNVRRRQGRWLEALDFQTRAAALDPLSTQTWYNLGLTYRALRRYDEAQAAYDRGLAAAPGDLELLSQKAETFQMQGDLVAAEKLVELLPVDSADPDIASVRREQWLYQKDYPRVIREIGQRLLQRASRLPGSVAFMLGNLGQAEVLSGDRTNGLAHIADSRKLVEDLQRAGNEAALFDLLLAQDAALLGDRETSYRVSDRAAQKLANDALILPQAIANQAFVRMHGGDPAKAVALLAQCLALPDGFGLSSAILMVDPVWDPLRKEPGFEALLTQAQTVDQAKAQGTYKP